MQKLKSNRASSMTILGIAIIVVLFLFATILIDIGRLREIRSSSSIAAQKSVQTGIMEQNRVGGLRPSAARRAAQEYLIQSDEAFGQFQSKCNGYPRFSFIFSNPANYKSKVYTLSSLPDDNSVEFMKMNYNTITMEVEDVSNNLFASLRGHCTNFRTDASATTSGEYDNQEIRR